MKCIRYLAAALLCCLLVYLPAAALSEASGVTGSATVTADGSCRVEMTLTLKLDTGRSDLIFPLPADAANIQLNGQATTAHKQGNVLQLQLPSLTAGTHVLQLRYELPCVIQDTKQGTLLSLPLLSGFGLDIAQLEFTVTLPGPITERPVFISGYHEKNIRLNTEVSENTLVAQTTAALKDHETLRLELAVDGDMFDLKTQRLLSGWDWATLVLILLALVYFALTLMPKFYRHSRSYTPPEGITAGEVGCCLTASGTDLSMMVLSWAQLGYLQLEVDKRGRVLLHKRMEMGNERSYHEGRIFQILFGRRETVDATAAHYARIHRKVAGRSPLLRQLYKPRSGDHRIFLALCCLAGLCSGVMLAQGSGFLMVLLGILMLLLSFGIQSGCKCIPLRSKLPLLVAIGCGLLWILLGSWLDKLGRVIPMVIFQFVAGVFAAYGGKRSQLGQRVLTQLMGLRDHMLHAGSFEMQQLQQRNPNYFYEMIPYALSMGIDRQFARRFDAKKPLPECGWLKNAPAMNAQQCAARLRQIVAILDKARYRKT